MKVLLLYSGEIVIINKTYRIRQPELHKKVLISNLTIIAAEFL